MHMEFSFEDVCPLLYGDEQRAAIQEWKDFRAWLETQDGAYTAVKKLRRLAVIGLQRAMKLKTDEG